MPLTPDQAAIPALPSQIKARLAHEHKRRQHDCRTCGRPFVGAQRRSNCFACSPYPAECDRAIAMRTKAHVSRQSLLKHAHKRMGRRPRVCARCGYALFVDICHIRAVRSFPDTTLVGVINAVNNLAFLCPNCHREFDAGLWDFDAQQDTTG